MELSTPADALRALKLLQDARYRDGVNTADPNIAADILDAAGFHAAAQTLRQRDQLLLETYRDRVSATRDAMQHYRIQGVPALIVSIGGKGQPIRGDRLYGPFENLKKHIDAMHSA